MMVTALVSLFFLIGNVDAAPVPHAPTVPARPRAPEIPAEWQYALPDLSVVPVLGKELLVRPARAGTELRGPTTLEVMRIVKDGARIRMLLGRRVSARAIDAVLVELDVSRGKPRIVRTQDIAPAMDKVPQLGEHVRLRLVGKPDPARFYQENMKVAAADFGRVKTLGPGDSLLVPAEARTPWRLQGVAKDVVAFSIIGAPKTFKGRFGSGVTCPVVHRHVLKGETILEWGIFIINSDGTGYGMELRPEDVMKWNAGQK